MDTAVTRARRAHAHAWLLLWAALALHVAEEALTGFLDVFNPLLPRLRASTGIAVPQHRFGVWISVLIAVLLLLLLLTPLVRRGAPGMRAGSYLFAGLMVLNGCNHLLSPLYLDGRWLPGMYTSPPLIAASLWLMRQAHRSSRTERQPGGRRTARRGTGVR